MSRRQIARTISKIFDPLVVLPLVACLAFAWALGAGLNWQRMLIVFLVDTIPVAIVLIGVVQRQGVKDWDIHSRPWRVPILLTAVGVQAFSIWLVLSWGYEQWAQLLTALAGITGVYLLITLKWRVSIHVGVVATIATLAVLFGGRGYSWLYGLVALVAWARVVGHDHTVAQALVGGLVPPVTLLITLLVVT